MGRVIRTVVSIGASLVGAAIGFAIGGPIGATIGAALFSAGARALMGTPGGPRRAAAAATLQIGEQPRQAIFGRSAVSGSLVDAFNYGGKYGTDWEVLVIALADHRCDALEGFFVDDRYIAFTGDGNVAGFNNQLQVFWRSGTWGQTVPTILTSNGPGWTANDRGRGVAYVVVAYKADDEKAKNPVWPSGRPRFRWVVRGLRCYQARKDSTVGGSGAHRWNDPATWQWTENPIDIAHNWRRGIYAGDLVDQPGMLLIGRGLSAIEAPPANVFARANLCDELVGGQPRYRIGGVAASTEPFIDVEGDFAAACAGVISQPEGAVEVDPGEAKAAVAHFTDGDLIVGSKVRWNKGILGQQDASWLNTVVARYVEPAQRWAQHSAPVLRDLADITADRAPREQQLALDFVTNGAQAQRVGEIFRRFGRLWGRATVTLPPRFAFIEEGDWVTWQSDRRFGGATLTFRVEAWGSDAAWHHTLTLRQISASVYSDTAPLDDGSIASDQPEPPVVAAPGVGIWAAAAVQLDGGGVKVPALRVTGATDDPAAQFVVFEYVQQTGAPDAGTAWTFASSSRPDVTRLDIPVVAGGTFWVAVSYVVDGILGDRRVIGPITTATLTYPDGTPVDDLQPGEGGSTRNVPRGTYDAGTTYVRGDTVIFSGSSYQLIVASSTGNAPPDVTRWALLANAGSGPAGADGLPGISVLVSNEAHVVATAADGSGGDYSAAGGTMRLLRGDTVLTPTFSIAAQTPASPSWISINSSTGAYTVSDPGVDLATATIRANWAGVNYDRTYTLAKSKAGVNGANGLNNARVLIYRRYWRTPALPSVPAIYTFSTGGLSGLNNGWTTSIPPAPQQRTNLLSRSAEFDNSYWLKGAGGTGAAPVVTANAAISPDGTIAADRIDFNRGAGNSLGDISLLLANVTLANGAAYAGSIYVKAASAGDIGKQIGLRHVGASSYGIITLTADWVRVERTEISFATSGSFEIVSRGGVTSGNQVSALIWGAQLEVGDVVTSYIPTGETAATANGGDPLYVSAATAASAASTDSIAENEWSAPVVLAQDGANGANGADGAAGLNSASVFLYRRSATVPPVPSVTSTYTFATGVLTGQNNSWTQSVPAGTDPLYVITASAASTGATDTIASGEWSSPSILAQNGDQGPAGPTLRLLTDSQAFTFTNGVANPASQTITLTAQLSGITGTATFTTTPSVTLGGTGNTRTLSLANFGANRQVTIEATLGGVTDRITIVRLERDPNTDITIDGSGNLQGIGTGAGTPVSNIGVVLSGTLAARPASGAFVGQTYAATDTREFFRWDGSAWAVASDVTQSAQITFTTPSPFQIQADSSGVTTTDLSTQTRSITLLRGGVAQTSGVTVGTPTGNPSASISVASATVSGGIVTVTLATANASGTVTIPIIFGGVTYPVTIPVNRTIAPPPSGGSGDTLFSDGSWANINTTTYTQVTDSGATVRSTSGGQLSFGFSAQYNGGNVQCKAQYSLDGTTWSDVAGTETTGTGPITVPGEEEPGSISRAPVTQSSLAASTLYFVRLVARRTGGTGTISWIAPSFTARQP